MFGQLYPKGSTDEVRADKKSTLGMNLEGRNLDDVRKCGVSVPFFNFRDESKIFKDLIYPEDCLRLTGLPG